MLNRRDSARRWQVERLAPLLHALARELRVGATLHTAIRAVAADAGVSGVGFREMARRVDDGAFVRDEIDRWARELDHPDASMVRAVLATGAVSGAALAATLDRSAERLGDRQAVHREIRTLSAQARASALVLTVAPVGFLVLMAALDQRVTTVVLTDPIGRVCLGLGAALDVVGWLWMRRLVAGVER